MRVISTIDLTFDFSIMPCITRVPCGAWLEIRTPNLAALRQAVLDAGLSEVHHPGHEFYFSIPGGQVFAVMPE